MNKISRMMIQQKVYKNKKKFYNKTKTVVSIIDRQTIGAIK